jgi:hypothetical protein
MVVKLAAGDIIKVADVVVAVEKVVDDGDVFVAMAIKLN